MIFRQVISGVLLLCANGFLARPALATGNPTQTVATTLIMATDDHELGTERIIAPGQEVLSSGVVIASAFVTETDIPLELGDIHYVVNRGSLIYKTTTEGTPAEGIPGTTTYCEKNRISDVQQLANKIGRDVNFAKANFFDYVHVCFLDSENKGFFDKAFLFDAKWKGNYFKLYPIEKLQYDPAHDIVMPNSRVGVKFDPNGKTFSMFYIRNGID